VGEVNAVDENFWAGVGVGDFVRGVGMGEGS